MDALFLKLLKLFDELGLWKDGVELIGIWSFLLYQRYLGVRPLPLRTQDVDFLLPWPYPARSTVGLSEALSDLGFRSESNPDGSNYFIHPELKRERKNLVVLQRGLPERTALAIFLSSAAIWRGDKTKSIQPEA